MGLWRGIWGRGNKLGGGSGKMRIFWRVDGGIGVILLNWGYNEVGID